MKESDTQSPKLNVAACEWKISHDANAEELADIAEADQRMADPSDGTISFEDLKKELGV